MVFRSGIFLVFWLVLDGAKPAGLVIGLPAALLAAWISLRLSPRSGHRVGWAGLPSLAWHFLVSSIVAGIDVAFRAFHPRLPLRTGFVTCDCRIPAGPKRDLFLAFSSLMPGSLPVEENENGKVVLHCLDTRQPQARQMAEHEAMVSRVIGGGGDA